MSVMADLREMQVNRDKNEAQEPLRDLRERMIRGYSELTIMSLHASTDEEHLRLSGKAEGVKLALSYVEEMLR